MRRTRPGYATSPCTGKVYRVRPNIWHLFIFSRVVPSIFLPVQNKILVAIPVARYDPWLENFELFPSCDYFIFDNSTDKRIPSVCQRREIAYVKAPKHLARLESWIECYTIASSKKIEARSKFCRGVLSKLLPNY